MNNPAGLATLTLLATIIAAVSPSACGQTKYPSKPIRLIVPYPPGGTADILARAIGQKLTLAWGQQVIIDNRGGANGNIGSELAARASADGHTLLLGTVGNLTVNPSLYDRMPYDVLKDLAPITNVASVPNVLVVNPSTLAVNSVKELVAVAKAKPGQLTFGSSGSGTTLHLSGELFKKLAGVDIVHVPYKGVAPALVDLLGGQISMSFASMPPTVPHIKVNRLRALGVTSLRRVSALPEIPPLAELGFPGFEAVSWYGVLAPAETPGSVIAALHGEIAKMLKDPDVRERFASQGADPIGNTPEQFAAEMRDDLRKWGRLVKESGAKLD
jgi:tripartite-type tricarboxylate transporter receptor subunit TctC